MELCEQLYPQVDHDFRNWTNLVSQFLDFYTFRYWIYKFSLGTKLRNCFGKGKGQRQHFGPAGPPVACARDATAQRGPHETRPRMAIWPSTGRGRAQDRPAQLKGSNRFRGGWIGKSKNLKLGTQKRKSNTYRYYRWEITGTTNANHRYYRYPTEATKSEICELWFQIWVLPHYRRWCWWS
jgi:hypothetical protein